MAKIEARIKEMGLYLPEPMPTVGGMELRFPWVRVHGRRVFISGHGAQNPDGSLAQPLGKVGAEVTLEQAQESAKLVGLSILASLKRELGDLDRVTNWLKFHGMVNSAPGFNRQPVVINGFTNLIIDLYGPE